jgi:hypothetical protein
MQRTDAGDAVTAATGLLAATTPRLLATHARRRRRHGPTAHTTTVWMYVAA